MTDRVRVKIGSGGLQPRLTQLASMKTFEKFNWKAIAASAFLAAQLSGACAAPSSQVDEFIAIVKTQIKTDQAAAALRDGQPDDFFRWGKEGCQWVRIGKANFEQLTENLASFFGDDLSAALVFAARRIICPDLH